MTPLLFGLLVKAAVYTVLISAISIALGISVGLGVAAARASKSPWLAGAARAYVSFFRGVPLLVQLLLIYNLLPAVGVNVPSVAAAVAGLALCTSAYQAENLRGGFLSVPKGLLESADMLGLTPWQQLVRLRAPIAFRLTLPAVVNEAILILKASSLVSVVGVVELTKMAQDLDTSLYKPIQLYSSAGLIYFLINRGVAGLGRLAERRFAWGQRR
jgi:polar amino acid transport system permease protein